MDLVRRDRARIVVTGIFTPEKEGIEPILELRRDYLETKTITMPGSGAIGGAGRLKMARRPGAPQCDRQTGFRQH